MNAGLCLVLLDAGITVGSVDKSSVMNAAAMLSVASLPGSMER